MEKKLIEKEIDNHINIRNNIWTALLVVAGGTLGLLVNPNSIIKILLIIFGILFFSVFLYAYFRRIEIVNKIIIKQKGQ